MNINSFINTLGDKRLEVSLKGRVTFFEEIILKIVPQLCHNV